MSKPVVLIAEELSPATMEALGVDCDLLFNLAESFGGNDTADYCIAAYLELLDKRFTGSGSHGLRSSFSAKVRLL